MYLSSSWLLPSLSSTAEKIRMSSRMIHCWNRMNQMIRRWNHMNQMIHWSQRNQMIQMRGKIPGNECSPPAEKIHQKCSLLEKKLIYLTMSLCALCRIEDSSSCFSLQLRSAMILINSC